MIGKTSRLRNLLTFHIPLTLIVAFIIAPFVWTLKTSLTPTKYIFTKIVQYLPREITILNYVSIISKIKIYRNIYNSLIVSLLTVIYAFSRYRFRGRTVLLGGILLLYLFPQVLFLVPLYVVFLKLRLIGTFLSLVIAYSTYTVPFAIWLLTGFFNQLPIELEQAAKIDGCTLLMNFRYIVFPLVRAGIVAAGSFIFITAWNEYLYAVLFTNDATKTITVALASFMSEYEIRWELLTAGGIITVIPVVVIFVFVQKNLIIGMTAGAVKG